MADLEPKRQTIAAEDGSLRCDMKRRQRIELIWELTRREVTGRYKGSLLDIGWSFAYPLLMLAIYTFVFSSIFRARWPGAGNDSRLMFATNLFAGLVVFSLASECATKSPSLVISQLDVLLGCADLLREGRIRFLMVFTHS